MVNLLQLRDRLVIDRFTVFCGRQIEPNVPTMVGPHAHAEPHLMILTRPPGAGPDPAYRVWYVDQTGAQHVVETSPFGIVYVRAGFQHWIEQTVPGALGGFACIFSNYGPNGRIEDPMREDEPGARYANG